MPIMDDPAPVPQLPCTDGAHLCVLASGSSGNCSVLLLRRDGMTRAILLDLGLSPRRTLSLLANAGIGSHQIDGALVTHLDHDHLSAGWRRQMPQHAKVWMHQRHARHTHGGLRDQWRLEAFDGEFMLDECIRVRPLMMSHDDLGVAAFRLDFSASLGGNPSSLGFATDLGHIDARLTEHFGGRAGIAPDPAGSNPEDSGPVDVLAIESNYCPVMQHASMRPDLLKQRIMGGHGHLSNQEAISAILQIEPREHVVLLHLSRECNSPEVVAALHAGADYSLTITSQFRPSRWVKIGQGTRATRSDAAAVITPLRRPFATLFDHVAAGAGHSADGG